MMNLTQIFWSEQTSFPVLAAMQLFPLAVMVLIILLRKTPHLFKLTVSASIIELLLGIHLYQVYEPHLSAMQLAEQFQLAGALQYHAAVDGISVMFILLAALLNLMIVLYSYLIPMVKRDRFLAMVFLILSSLISQFAVVDLLWFSLASALQLLVVGYLLWYWATSPERDLAGTRYLQFMTVAILLLLAGVLMLGWTHSDQNGNWSFDLFDLVNLSIPVYIQSIIFFLLFYGLAIRIPLFPLHGWLPITAHQGMVAIAPVYLLGVKVGVYALVRFVFPLLPEAVTRWHEYVVTFAVAGVFYAALLAMMQNNLRRLLAFAVVSHTSILIIGLFSLNHFAFQGGLMLAVNFGLAITGLVFIAGFIYWRTRTLMLSRLGGLFDQLTLFGITFFISGLAIVGMPGTPGFDSVHLVLEASIERFGALITVAAAVGNVIAAGFLLWAFQKAFLAPQKERLNRVEINPASMQEKLLALLVVGILLGVGFYSEPWLDLIEHSLENLSQIYSHVEPGMNHE